LIRAAASTQTLGVYRVPRVQKKVIAEKMNFLPKLVWIGCLIFLTAQPLFAQSKDRAPRKHIAVCRIELTDMGRTARFHFNYMYSLQVKTDGSVEQIAKLREKEYPAFVREEKLIECMKTWKLEPAGKYVVNVSFGTSGDEDSITIVAPNRESVRLILPKD
jgi:hypothetical protein